MKFLKIFTVMLGAFALASCSNNDDKPTFNTLSGVTVSLEQADITFSENRGIVKVPFKVTGERNGYIAVTCEVKEYGSDVAMENVHYLLTTETVNVTEEDNEGYFEIRLVDDKDENENRTFELTLANVKGGSISGINNTVVTIKDNDSDPYARLGGEWFVPNAGTTRTVSFKTFEEGEEGYYEYYMIEGLVEDGAVQADFKYNPATMQGEISIEYGQKLPEYVHSSYGVGEGQLGWIDGEGYIELGGTAVFTWGEDHTQLLVDTWAGEGDYPDEGPGFYYLLHFSAGWMLYDSVDDVTGFYRTRP